MAKNIRTPAQIDHDRAELARLYLRGWPQREIAKRLGVVQQQVSYDLGVVRRRWQESAVRDFNADKERELAKVDELERTYWEAWERSIGTHEKSRTGRRGADGEDAQSWAQIEREELVGNPAFLAGVMSCIKRRCEILGLDAPAQHELSGPGGGPIATTGYAFQESIIAKLSQDEVDRLITEAEAMARDR